MTEKRQKKIRFDDLPKTNCAKMAFSSCSLEKHRNFVVCAPSMSHCPSTLVNFVPESVTGQKVWTTNPRNSSLLRRQPP